jgi:hypothetical protein
MARDSYNSAKNIIVGASPLFINQAAYDGDSNLDPTKGTDKVTFSTSESYTASLNAAPTKWRNVGYTNNGLQITYNPTYGNVTVDQLLDTAKLFKESMEVMLATEMAEGTLENILVVFGQPGGSSAITESSGFDGDETLTTAEPTSSTPQVLGLAAGALLQAPVERQLIAVGPAPDYNVTSYAKNERVYYARRVLSVQQSQFSLARNTPTTFPVTFRLLPSGDAAYAGQEYGKIIDRVYA